MKKIVVIYYSRTGNTKKMSEMIAEGARIEGEIQVDVFDVENFSTEKVLEYDCIIVGSPTYYGSMACQIKKFFDETVVFHGKLSGKVGGAFSSAANIGGGNETTILDILNAMLIHGMIIRGNEKGDHYGPVSIGSPDTRVEKQSKEFGSRIAALAKRM